MGIPTLNGSGSAPMAADGGRQGGGSDGAGMADGHAGSDCASLRLTLAATERRFAAALRQLERMRRRDAFYEQKVALLEEAATKAQRFVYHDELTNLPNRRLLADRFDQSVALATRRNVSVGLLLLDLDRLEHVNAVLGHSAGDRLLQQIAVRLVDGMRASDTACRYGGGEFVVLLAEINGKEGALIAAKNLRARLAVPYVVDGAAVTISTSVGVAVYPDDARGYDDLIQAADLAMRRHRSRRPPAPTVLDAPSVNLRPAGRVVSLLDPQGR